MKTGEGLSCCPRCGGELNYNREIERPVREGNNVAIVKIVADVCTKCGELLYHPQMVELMERTSKALKEDSLKAPVVGRVYDLRDRAV